MALFGKYLCYALLALSIDLIWGYCGILSLGHGAFFALGGYAMGMYLMRQIGTRGVYAHPVLPDFMVFLNWPELPVYWYGFQHFPYALLMVVLVPGALAFVFGWFAFRSRVTGVYLSIITQALTFALMLGFFRNNFGFGGNNGLTDFKDILGFNVQAPGTRAALFVTSASRSMLGFLICRVIVSSKFGKVLVAIRDAEARTRFLGYRVEAYKLFVFTLSACMAGVAGALYVPQVGIINPSEFSPANSIEAVIWVAVGGRGTLTGAVLGAVLVNYGKTYFTSGFLAPYWLFVLGGLFVAVTLLLPRGIVGTIHHWWGEWQAAAAGRRSRGGAGARRGAAAGGVSDGPPHHHGAALSQRRDRVVRRLPRAQQSLVHDRARRDARHHRPERRRQDHHDGRRHRQDPARHRRRLLRRHATTSRASTRPRSRCSASAASSRSRPCSTCTRSRTISALALKGDRRARKTLFWRETAEEASRINSILEIIRLSPVRERVAGSLSHGQKQWLEIGMLLAQEPKLLLVDEPVAGMTDAETRQTAELLKEINRDRTVVVVEHDMTFVRELGVKVTCLHEGSVLAEGTIDQVSENERVVEVYLGRLSNGSHPMLRSVEAAPSTLHYGAAQALRGVSLTAEPGKVTCVLGRNGVGKTSLLDALAGQHPISKGAITLDGADITRLKPERARAARHRLCAAGARNLSAAHGRGEPQDRLCAAQARANARSRTTCSRCFRCSATCCAGAAATCPAASSSSSRSAGRWSCGRGCCCWTSRPRASSPRSSRISAAPSPICAISGRSRWCWSSSISTLRSELGDHFVVMDRGAIVYSCSRDTMDEAALRRAMAL